MWQGLAKAPHLPRCPLPSLHAGDMFSHDPKLTCLTPEESSRWAGTPSGWVYTKSSGPLALPQSHTNDAKPNSKGPKQWPWTWLAGETGELGSQQSWPAVPSFVGMKLSDSRNHVHTPDLQIAPESQRKFIWKVLSAEPAATLNQIQWPSSPCASGRLRYVAGTLDTSVSLASCPPTEAGSAPGSLSQMRQLRLSIYKQ